MMVGLSVYREGRRGNTALDEETEQIGKITSLKSLSGSQIEINRRQKYVGLVNQGATCYLNSLLQTLFHTPEFKRELYKWEYRGEDIDGEEDECIPLQLQTLFARLDFGAERHVTTNRLTQSFGWCSREAYQQHDVQEMSKILFDALEQHKESGCDKVTNVFEGQLVNYIICLNCKKKRCRRESFQDISLVVDEESSEQSIPQALKKYVKSELLNGENQYHCEECDAKVDAYKGVGFLRFPQILTLHLKRFVFDWQTDTRNKLQNCVKIPMELDVSQLQGLECVDIENNNADGLEDPIGLNSEIRRSNSINPADVEGSESDSDSIVDELNEIENQGKNSTILYELSGILIHVGNANSGHYYAINETKSESKRKVWHEFNDISVSELEHHDVERMCNDGMLANGGAYMLVYRRREDDPVLCGDSNEEDLLPSLKVLEKVNIENSEIKKVRDEDAARKFQVRFKVLLQAGLGIQNKNGEVERDDLLPNGDVYLSYDIRKANLSNVKKEARQKLLGANENEFPLESLRLRRYYIHDERIGEELIDEKIPLEKIGVNNSTVMLLEYSDGSSVSRDAYYHEDLQLKLHFWDYDEKCSIPICSWYKYRSKGPCRDDYKGHEIRRFTSLPPVCVKEGSKSTVRNLQDKVHEVLGIQKDLLKLYKLPDEEHENVIELTDEEALLKDEHKILSGDIIIVGLSTDNSIAESLNGQLCMLDIYFNNPSITNIKKGPAIFDNKVRLNKSTSLSVAKQQIIEKLGLGEPDGFHLCLSEKACMLKDEKLTLDDSGLTNQSVLFVGNGKPLRPDEYSIKILISRKESDQSSQKLKFKCISKLVVSENDSMISLYNQVLEKVRSEKVVEKEKIFGENVEIRDIVLREKILRGSGIGAIIRPTKRSIESSIKNLTDGKRLVLELTSSGNSESDTKTKNEKPDDKLTIHSALLCEEGIHRNKDLREFQISKSSNWATFCDAVKSTYSSYCSDNDVDIDIAVLSNKNSRLDANLLSSLEWSKLRDKGLDSKYAPHMNISRFPIKIQTDSLVIICKSDATEQIKQLQDELWFCDQDFNNSKNTTETTSIRPNPPLNQQSEASIKRGTFILESGPTLKSKKDIKKATKTDNSNTVDESIKNHAETKISENCDEINDDDDAEDDEDSFISPSNMNRSSARDKLGLDSYRDKEDDFWAGATPVKPGVFKIETYDGDESLEENASEDTRDDEKRLSKKQMPSTDHSNEKKVPALDLSAIPTGTHARTYHEEFMSKQDEWSESWREASGLSQKLSNIKIGTQGESKSKSKSKRNKGMKVEDKLNDEGIAQVGVKVFAKAQHWNRFFPGIIFSKKKKNNSGSKFLYTIDFDDGDRLEDVPFERMRIPAENAKKNENKNKDKKIIVGLDDDGTNLCPTDRRQRKREKLACRDFRLGLMYVDGEGDESMNSKEIETVTKSESDFRARTSPTSSEVKTYVGLGTKSPLIYSNGYGREDQQAIDNVLKLFPSKTHRLKSNLEPLHHDARATTMPGRTRSDESPHPVSLVLPSRLPKLKSLKPKLNQKANLNLNDSGETVLAVSTATPQYNQNGRKLISHPKDGIKESASMTKNQKKLKPLPKMHARRSKEKLEPLPNI